jgi:hypothetical protein
VVVPLEALALVDVAGAGVPPRRVVRIDLILGCADDGLDDDGPIVGVRVLDRR